VSDLRLRTLPHLIRGRYNIAGILASSGRVFEWFRHISGQDRYTYEEMLKNITELPHNEDRPFFFPSLHTGATWEFAGGAFFYLQPFHTPMHLGRAVVEAIGFGIRDHIETLEERGCPVTTMVTSGGQARNALWIQMKADITGKKISVPRIVDAELLGDACAGVTALGLFPTLSDASRGLLRIERTFSPSPGEHEAFTRSYEAYNRICAEALTVAPSGLGNHSSRGR
jgi:xylulokinase